MKTRIEILHKKHLAGIHRSMSLSSNTTGELWRNFMSRLKEIPNRVSNDLISMQVHEADYFVNFNPDNKFEKWAAVEIYDFNQIPAGIEAFTLDGGLYVVFDYKGSGNDPEIFQYIFGTWLPQSDYVLDNRPHFEVLGEKYKNADPTSEEEIWIPVRRK